MKDSLRLKLALLVGGTLFGVGFGALVAFGIGKIRGNQLPQGAVYENPEELRRAMLSRDERDVHPDGSVSLRSIIMPDDSDKIIYRLMPSIDVKFEGAGVKTNSFGFRGPEVSAEKPPGVFRVALLGDSFAFGWGVDEEKIFARVAERELNNSTEGKSKVEVLNFGVPGYSTFQEVALYEAYGQKFSPDVVVVYFIENDFGLPFFIKNFSKNGELVNNRHFQDLKEDAEDTEAEASNNALLNNLNPKKAIERLGALCQLKGIPLLVVVNPGKNWEKMERRLQSIKKLPGVKLVSIREETKRMINESGLPPEKLRLPKDPHPSAAKHEMLGKAIAGKLLPILNENLGRMAELSR